MKNRFSIEEYYDFIAMDLLLAERYLEKKNIVNLIKACRLKPFPPIRREAEAKKILFKTVWIDEFNNLIKISNKKNVLYDYGFLDMNVYNSTDPYRHLPIDKVFKMSDKVYLMEVQTEEEEGENIYLATFLGIDNYFRTFYWEEGEWIPTSSLLLQFKHLNRFFKNYEQFEGLEFVKFEDVGKNFLGCTPTRSWLISSAKAEKLHQVIGYDLQKIFNFTK